MPAKRGMVRALYAGAKEEEAAARARTHRSKGKKERKKKKKKKEKKTHGPRNARGRSRCSSAKRSSLWPAYSYDRAPRSPRRSRPGVKCQLLAGRETARKREIQESDFGSGGERTCRARYPSWVRHHLGYAPGHGRLIVPPATLRRPERRPRIVPTAPKTLHISSEPSEYPTTAGLQTLNDEARLLTLHDISVHYKKRREIHPLPPEEPPMGHK
ncbi:hypothetical protein HPB50_014344 [Hyalomma asiaticum]|uniref:Uncharacterized protein n=1 Tax=Hyalomma asiaticum TaxID=266040 RepID=A0ACB7SFD4_HYAAI|nr:hypothetical protein HPB50_014344 [Hyalomma asiaticum]